MDFTLDNDIYLKNIIKNMKIINNEYNNNHNFKPLIRVKSKKINQNDYNIMAEGNLLNNRIDKLSKIRNLHKKKKNKNEVEKVVDIVNDNIINHEDGTKNKSWKQLTDDDKLKQMNLYLDMNKSIDITDALREKIIILLKNGKLDYRKYIIYDKVNNRIEEIPLIRLNKETNSYYLLTDLEKKSKKCHKKKISKIFKIK
jgi:hypothetical protein